ncbi:Per1-like protein [Scenedesmus sp. NREL 46B-D3]|nr:Per1-like protein [Scenedesmus sp. NREL 46B-D3]
MQWDCAADCSYNCMWALEGARAASLPRPVYKYFGKWPFIRVLGAQEIASVLFSIANMLAHAHCMRRYLCYVRTSSGCADCGVHGYPYYWLWLVYSMVNVNAWLWSSVFHCRDTKATERLDYFQQISLSLAGAAAANAATAAGARVVARWKSAAACLYMAFIKFDYGYNMKVCIAFGLATALTWLVWVSRVRHPGRRTLYRFMVLVHVAMLLEVLDFPPLFWLLDAHALWHAATVPLTYLWYKFVFADVAWLATGHSSTLGAATDGAAPGSVKQKQ